MEMEKFELLLSLIQVKLRIILTKNKGYMLSWDVPNLKNTGDDLIKLAQEVYPQLVEVEHRILHYSLRDAGLGMRIRALEIQKRRIEEEDKEYFRGVHDALENICKKIETGEYYKELKKIGDSKLRSNKF